MRTSLALALALAVLVPAAARAQDDALPTAPSVPVRAAFGEGIGFGDPEGAFFLRLRGRLQLRFDALGSEPGSSQAPRNGFAVRRARLNLEGHVLPELKFKLQLGMSTQDMESSAPNVLRDGSVTWTRWRDLNVQVGQGKVPYDRQRLNSSSDLQFPDRAQVTSEFTLDRDVGLQLRSDDLFGLDGRILYALGVFGGDGRNRLGTAPGLLVVARLGVRPMGAFEDEAEADLEREPSPRLALYAGVARNHGTSRVRSTNGGSFQLGTVTYNHALLDGIFKWRGVSVSGAAHLRVADDPVIQQGPLRELAHDGWGAYLQAGWLFLPEVEAVGRVGRIRPIDPETSSLEPRDEVSAGLGWYLQGQDLKLQADYSWLPDVGTTTAAHQVRVQLQVYF